MNSPNLPDLLKTLDVSTDEARTLQQTLATKVERHDRLPSKIRYVAGVDVAYGKDGDERVYAGVVVIDSSTGETVETVTAIGESSFPYTPGLFAFRELPHLLKAYDKLTLTPDLVICDGQGVAHPRRCGLASHLGLLLDIPTIGCGKTCLLGKFTNLGEERGSHSPLIDENQETIGHAVRTQTGIKPLYVSIGHRVNLVTATNWILKLASQYRQPEPIRRADNLVNQLRAESN